MDAMMDAVGGNISPDVLASFPPHWTTYDADAGTMNLNVDAFGKVDSRAKADELVQILGGGLQVDRITHSWLFQERNAGSHNYIGG